MGLAQSKTAIVAQAFLGLTLVSKLGCAAELTTQERRGEQIYRQGTGASEQPIMARIGGGYTTVNAALLPCINCHGPDAQGRAEGGVSPANITWDALTKPYRVITADGQGRPPYDDRLLIRAISLGFDSDGRELDQTMPRYTMSRNDIVELIAYLKVVGTAGVPGVTASHLTLMVILPPAEKPEGFSESIKQIVTRFFEDVNKSGGVYSRQVTLEFFYLPDALAETSDALGEFIEDKQPLALVASYMAGREEDIVGVLEQKWIPSNGAFTLLPSIEKSQPGPVFYLFPGLAGESRALASAFIHRAHDQVNAVAIVYSDRRLWRHAASAITRTLQDHDKIEVTSVPIPVNKQFPLETLVEQLLETDTDALFLLTPGETGRRLVRAISATSWRPAYYSPGTIAESVYARELPATGSPLYLSWSTLPVDQEPKAVSEFRAFLDGADQQDRKYPSEKLHAIAAAKVLLEGLRRAGHDVTRKKLVESLEGLYGFSTGLTPKITFGPNRRIGSRGAHVVEFDVESRKEIQRRWFELD